ncbi:MAG: fibrobacter succinogenes major paralogous domain-containing protein [Bacteroidetes bacterium]|nr:fibrobacter succinogenes major paralogous domain-containing protein [Bacteroidota bacterium]
MKKIFKKIGLFIVLGFSVAAFNACNKEETPQPKENKQTSLDTDCVVINGVIWATHNVGEFGKFAENPESAGMFYQWNRKKAWSVTDPKAGIKIDDWNATNTVGIMWESANNPCPQGWRMPTNAELETLFDTDKVTNKRTTQNGVAGRLFTDKATGRSMFLPAVGYRYYHDGELRNAGDGGYYWASDGNQGEACFLYFYGNAAGVGIHPSATAFSIRPVRIQ